MTFPGFVVAFRALRAEDGFAGHLRVIMQLMTALRTFVQPTAKDGTTNKSSISLRDTKTMWMRRIAGIE